MLPQSPLLGIVSISCTGKLVKEMLSEVAELAPGQVAQAFAGQASRLQKNGAILKFTLNYHHLSLSTYLYVYKHQLNLQKIVYTDSHA